MAQDDVQVDDTAADETAVDETQSTQVDDTTQDTPQVQYDETGAPTTYADGSPFEYDGDGNVIYDDAPEVPEVTPETPAAQPFNTPTNADANPALTPILTEAEQQYYAQQGITPDAQNLLALMAQRMIGRSEHAMIASNYQLQQIQTEAPDLWREVGSNVTQRMAELAPEIRARPDSANLAYLMAVEVEARNAKTSVFKVLDRHAALRGKKQAAPPAAPTPARQRAPQHSTNAPARNVQQSRQRAPRLGVGLGLTPSELRALQDDPSISGRR